MKFVLSSGHGLKVRGAAGPKPWGLDEVNEARRVVPEVAERLRKYGHTVVTFNDDTSTTQDQNLKTIVNFHNSQSRNLDVSFHMNAYIPTDGGRGVEVLYVTQAELAAKVSAAIASAGGFIDRGPKKRSDLYFLNGTTQPAILIETCFCDAKADCEEYKANFDAICQAIADCAAPVAVDKLQVKGKVSWFGGPSDDGVTPSEGLAFIYKYEDKPEIFLKQQPPGTTGLARRLDPEVHYLALRWDYEQFSKNFLRGDVFAKVYAPKTGRVFLAHPADWGPHTSTGRVADISPGLMEMLGIKTDDTVEIEFPFEKAVA